MKEVRFSEDLETWFDDEWYHEFILKWCTGRLEIEILMRDSSKLLLKVFSQK